MRIVAPPQATVARVRRSEVCCFRRVTNQGMGFPSAWAIFVQDWCRLRLRAFALVDDQENEGDGQQAGGHPDRMQPPRADGERVGDRADGKRSDQAGVNRERPSLGRPCQCVDVVAAGGPGHRVGGGRQRDGDEVFACGETVGHQVGVIEPAVRVIAAGL
jgi:hypothetical protein